MIDLAPEILDEIAKQDPQAFGDVVVSSQSKHFTVTGRLHTTLDRKSVLGIIQKIVKNADPTRSVYMNLEMPRKGLRVRTDNGKTVTEATTRRREKKPLDELEIIYVGMVSTASIATNNSYKRVNHETFKKVHDPIKVLRFVAPVVLDKNFKIIDGNLRVEIALKEGIEEIPAVVVNDDGTKSNFLRLAINRSTEFQRWKWDEVDAYVDSVPQAQPLLEPLGFFGDKILPTTFFSKTLLNYEIDEFNDQMKQYSQDIGLAKWAEIKRKEALRRENRIKAARDKKTDKKNAVSLFDLKPKAADFLETYDAPAEIRKNTLEMQGLAGTITEAFDAKRKLEMEEKGKVWQNTRRTSKMLANDKREASKKTKTKSNKPEDKTA